ncbi:transmembrane protein 79 [Mastacembelus armatus]|uniref:transmembrane protein 79 n=1 Tax=Mastacembelus armatus TaxID=205130 RepID=UPI000E45E1BF|nr:transmembrane protein 79 [Mastacembelus armatus]XP_026173056.1 transmembrane protein 79 [Mastacembelus armatus]XP_026173057.1 transmembrane protein 79 [Mastacembelus armatus]XP_026173059.1 transmembrane protein 79 [Mastacembelus armatus]XP_026173060.1 transmembrane protein 79 [Mastacembelus armatus]
MTDSGGTKTRSTEGEDEVVKSAMMEPSTLQWTRDRQADGQTGGQPGRGDRMSVRSSEAASWTESERELAAEGLRKEGGGGEGRGKGEEEEADPQTHLGGGEEPVENHLPEKAAQVFSPAMSIQPCPLSPREHAGLCEIESEKSPFLGPQGVPQDYSQHVYQYEWAQDTPPTRCRCGCPSRDVLKVGVSLMMSALLFPFLVWGGFVFLPFDAPLMDGAPLRLVYTLRCSVFAAVPIILGWLVLGVTRIRSGALRPLFDDEVKEAEHHEVTVHRRFISDSASLFLMYFLQLVVMAMYLSQQNLKLVPLLTVIFAFGRLVYWVAAAFGSSIRGFGFGLSFLPSLTMMVANIYFIFTLEAAGSIFSLPSPPEEELTLPAGKQRFWG